MAQIYLGVAVQMPLRGTVSSEESLSPVFLVASGSIVICFLRLEPHPPHSGVAVCLYHCFWKWLSIGPE